MTTDTLHASPGLVIRHARRGDGDLVVVTFSDMLDRGAAEPEAAFGWRWLARHGISQIAVCAERPDWFQCPGFMEGMAAVSQRIAAEGYRRSTLYGLSMGGFGALLAAPVLRPGRILALAPQISVDPAAVPWERRFAAEVSQISPFRWRIDPDAGRGSTVILLHDPLKGADHRHVRLIRRGRVVSDLPAYGARHNLVAWLAARGAGAPLLAQLQQRAPPGALRREIRSLRRADPRWRPKMERRLGAARVAAILAACARAVAQRVPG
ncbi:hypothetical protein [Neotabrizicola sp. VNH66]|uniref:hypothetical protein n=1 Tax=Neotabrizicola sp. VNH66 TaxID=3400918 RepID=UPI003C071D05